MINNKKELRNVLIEIINDKDEEMLCLIAEAVELANSLVNSKIPPDDANDQIKIRIVELLKKLGVPSNIKGYNYLIVAIMQMLKNPEEASKMTKVLYPAIAKEFNTTPSRVGRSIRHAIETSFAYAFCFNRDLINDIFGCAWNSNKEKPTNSQFIVAVTEFIRYGFDLKLQ